jgi:hypothetical protein
MPWIKCVEAFRIFMSNIVLFQSNQRPPDLEPQPRN